MNLPEIIMIGIGLSMDAVAVSLTNGMVYRMGQDKKFMMPVFFGIFQGLMPMLGYCTGGIFSEWLVQYSGLIIFLILGFLGVKMLKEGLSREQLEKKEPSIMTYGVLFMQAVATSIDAFAVGIAFCSMKVSIYSSAAIICLTTFLCSFLAVLLGKKFGELLGKKAEVLGGSILVFLALKAILF